MTDSSPNFDKDKNVFRFLKNILQLILSPVHGWEEISYDGAQVDKLTAEGLYPLMGLAAATAFVQGFYDVEFSLMRLIQTALAIFIVLFISFWFGRSMMETFLEKYTEKEPGTLVGGTVAVYTSALLCLIQIFNNFMPVELPILMLLPTFIIIIIWNADQYLSIAKDMRGQFLGFATLVLIAPSIALNYILSLLF
jgi:hypothetical protein